MWLPASEALRRLKVKPQTLYANVSRGRVGARPDPADPRRSLYSSEDIDRLARRSGGRPRTETVAAEAINWGDPVLSSSISTIAGSRLYYRGHDAAVLSRTATLEEVAALLWGAFPLRPAGGTPPAEAAPLAAAFAALARQAANCPPSYGRGATGLQDDAADVLAGLADALLGGGNGPLHARLAERFDRSEAAVDIRRALVLLADHELNASTFAARVAVSTGAGLAAGALSGLAALTGPLHGSAAAAVRALADDLDADPRGPVEALREWLGEGRSIPGFGHRLYPSGDARAAELLSGLRVPAAYERLCDAAETLSGERPNIDFAIAALAAQHHLPREAPLMTFALSRCVGWLAHMLEQVENGALIRPRARYTGPKPSVP